MTLFRASVEAWRPLVTALNTSYGNPIEFLLSWIDVESGGNVCAIGACGDANGNTIPSIKGGPSSCANPAATFNKETGLWQLYFSSPGSVDKLTGGATYGQLRNYCSGLSGSRNRDLTDDEKAYQVTTGLDYIQTAKQDARDQLQSGGASWAEDSVDFWRLVKLQHALPSIPKIYFPMFFQLNGRGPTGWDEFVTFVYAHNNSSLYHFALDNAEKVGAYASGFKLFGTIPTWFAIALGVVGTIGLVVTARRVKRKYPATWKRFHLPEKITIPWVS